MENTHYDIFISYSRKDISVADRICAALDKQKISYFIDRKGIGGGMEFPSVIADAIQNSKIILFLASNNSYNSKFTKKEVTFAFNEKPSGSLLPYVIDGSQLPTYLRFSFADINIRTIEEHPIETTLMKDLCQLLGITYKSEEDFEKEKKNAEDELRLKIEKEYQERMLQNEQQSVKNMDVQMQEKDKTPDRDFWYVVGFVIPLVTLGLGIWYGMKVNSFWIGTEIFLFPGWCGFWLCNGLADKTPKGKYLCFGLALLGLSIAAGIHIGILSDSVIIGVISGFVLSIISLYVVNKG